LVIPLGGERAKGGQRKRENQPRCFLKVYELLCYWHTAYVLDRSFYNGLLISEGIALSTSDLIKSSHLALFFSHIILDLDS